MLVTQRFFSFISAVVALVGCAAHAVGNSATATQELSGGQPPKEHLQMFAPSVTRLVLLGELITSMDPGTEKRDADVCRSWKYESSSLKEHLLSMKQVSKSDWGRLCYQYACSAIGEAELEGRVFSVEVNAGGWISLDAPGKASTFWASHKQMPGFLAACDCCE